MPSKKRPPVPKRMLIINRNDFANLERFLEEEESIPRIPDAETWIVSYAIYASNYPHILIWSTVETVSLIDGQVFADMVRRAGGIAIEPVASSEV